MPEHGITLYCLPSTFFARPARVVARDLLGRLLIRCVNGERIGGLIVETEAYCDANEPDLACHGAKNKGRPTKRTAVMFGPPGHAFVYFTYGMHWLLNVVTGSNGRANAVLLRAIEPCEGLDYIALRRPSISATNWTNGPGKLTAAMNIDGSLNGHQLTAASGKLWIEQGSAVNDADVCTGARVGLGKTPEPWLSVPWRYWVAGNPCVSRYR